MEKLEKYACNICGYTYLREDLKQTCENKLQEPLIMPIGRVFRCPDDYLAILYDTKVVQQTHENKYVLLRISPLTDPMMFVPGVEENKEYVLESIPITDIEFNKVCSELNKKLHGLQNPNIDHIIKLSALELQY